MNLARKRRVQRSFPLVRTMFLALALIGSSSVVAVPAEFRLTALPTPSGSDTALVVPASQSGFALGSSIFMEVWVQTTDPNGLSSASLDLLFDAALATGVAITPTALFSELLGGTIDNNSGVVNDLSGSHLGPCTDAVAVAPNWARLAVVEFVTNANGLLSIDGGPSGSQVYGTAICGFGDIDPADIIFDSVTLAIGEAGIPAVSTWGMIALCLSLAIAGTLVLARHS